MRLMVIILVLLCSCSPTRMMETSLYFGQAKASGGTVSEKEWRSFRDDHITRVFKDGSTIISVQGQWFDPEKKIVITEPTYVVVCFYKPSQKISRQIDSLRIIYKSQYDQQSVLRVDHKVKVSF